MSEDVAELARRMARERARETARERASLRAGLGPAPWKVQRTDLDKLEAVKTLLSALNDPFINADDVLRLVTAIPVLSARCVKRARSEDDLSDPLVEDALRMIGNHGLEGELLSVLEDLTILAADEG